LNLSRLGKTSRHCAAAAILVIAGCSPELPPAPRIADHHGGPITKADIRIPTSYTELVKLVQGYRDQIRAAIEAGSPEKANRAMDALDLVLDEVTPLATQDLPAQRQDAVNLARRDLREAFLTIRESIAQKQPPDYAVQSVKIEAAIDALAAANG
jgi:hypothetical protein